MQLQERGFSNRTVLFFLLLFLAGTFTVSPATADLQSELTARLHSAYPPFTGKVREISGTTLIIQQTSPEPVQPGSMLLVGGKTQVRVLSVDGMTVRAGNKESQRVRPGEPVSGLPRPLQVALVPLSRESLQYLLMHPLPKGEIETVRTEDVLTAMIEKGFSDFATMEQQDLTPLEVSLPADIILKVRRIEGLGTKLLRIEPLAAGNGGTIEPFSVMLTPGTYPSAARNLIPPSPIMEEAPTPMPVMIPAKPGSPTAFVPLVPEQQGPALSLLPATTSVSPAPLPKLPSLDDFDDPAHWQRVLMLEKRIMAMSAGHFTEQAKKELVIGLPGKVQVYSFHKGTLTSGPRLESGKLSSLFWLDAWDVNGDGIDEIIVDTGEGVFLLTYQGEELRIVKREKDLALRRVGSRLLGQKLSGLRGEEGPIREIRWGQSGWETGELLDLTGRANLFALVDLTSRPPVMIDSGHNLRKGDLLLSKKECGESNNPQLLDLPFPLFGRSFVFPEGYLLFHNKPEPWPHISRSGYNNGGSACFISKREKALLSPSFRGYISDIVYDDFDGDGQGEVVISQVVKGLGGGAFVLRYK